MQIQLLIQNNLTNSSQYQNLFRKLNKQYLSLQNSLRSQQCLKKISSLQSTSPQQFEYKKSQCKRKVNHFNTYLELYKKQFIEKGEEICLNQFEQVKFENVNNKDSFSRMIKEMLGKQTDCLMFYNKGSTIFLENVNDKLRSLAEGLSFTQL